MAAPVSGYVVHKKRINCNINIGYYLKSLKIVSMYDNHK